MSENPPFSEREFYLAEFRGRTLAVVLQKDEETRRPELLEVLDLLRSNSTRTIVVAPGHGSLEGLDCEVLGVEEDRLEGQLWRALRRRGRVALVNASAVVPSPILLDLARRLDLYKVILLTENGGHRDPEGRRRAFVDLAELERLLTVESEPRNPRLREVEGLLGAGVNNVNLCTVEGLFDELFTYSGSGTLFTRRGHSAVRPLGIDDYDSADDLIARGVAEGFLAPRDESAIDLLLPRAFGAFVGDSHLAGIGALLVDETAQCGEIASLYAVTRFLREGVGAQLVSHALRRARELDLEFVFACTTSKRAGEFFQRLGFEAVAHDEVPSGKWKGYDAGRKAAVTCFRLDLDRE